MPPALDSGRHVRPRTPDDLWRKVWLYHGVRVVRDAVCAGCDAPFDALACWQLTRPAQAILEGPRGGGKAQPLSAMVQTPDGPRPMGEIEVGDAVCHPDGGLSTVLAIHPQGMIPVYRVGFRDGSFARCCGDHLWEVSTRVNEVKFRTEVISTLEMKSRLFRPRGEARFFVKLPEPLDMGPRGSGPFHRERVIPPYNLGVLIGDGCFRASCVMMTSADEQIIDRVQSGLPERLAVRKHSGKYAYAISGGKRNVPNPYKDEIRRLGLWGKKSEHKFIPAEYLYGTVEERWELLRGLMDTDGTIGSTGKVTYSTSSPDLARDVAWLIESLGGIARIRPKKTNRLPSWNVGVTLPDVSMAFHLSRKKARAIPRTKYFPKRVVTSVEFDGFETCQCITVSAEDGLYLTDSCIVTHNSFLSSIDTHLDSRHNPRHGTRILAGSKAQAKQVHGGLDEAVINGKGPTGYSDRDQIRKFQAEKATYVNGSTVEILTASPLSVRGPHVPCLKMDEVDEIDPEIRNQAMGMVMEKLGVAPKLVQTSTHHNLGGPMEEIKELARLANAERPGSYPSHRFCAWEVARHCGPERSGPFVGGKDAFLNCPSCPLRPYCHEDIGEHPSGLPKAKRAGSAGLDPAAIRSGSYRLDWVRQGHYALEALDQKLAVVSRRILEADYFCKGPKADGLWFDDFEDGKNGNVAPVEVDRNLPIFVAIDTGVSYHAGAIFYQVGLAPGNRAWMRVFGDWYAEGLHTEAQCRAIKLALHDVGVDEVQVKEFVLDPASKMQSGHGLSALTEYQRAFGQVRVVMPPQTKVHDGLDFLEKMVRLADGTRLLTVDPRCKHSLRAFKSYRRRKFRGVYLGEPENVQHPAEELVDSYRYALWRAFPRGFPVPTNLRNVHASYLM